MRQIMHRQHDLELHSALRCVLNLPSDQHVVVSPAEVHCGDGAHKCCARRHRFTFERIFVDAEAKMERSSLDCRTLQIGNATG
jgi:hypothetical protein